MKKYDYKPVEEIRMMVLEKMCERLTDGIKEFSETPDESAAFAFCIATGAVKMANAILDELDQERPDEQQ